MLVSQLVKEEDKGGSQHFASCIYTPPLVLMNIAKFELYILILLGLFEKRLIIKANLYLRL